MADPEKSVPRPVRTIPRRALARHINSSRARVLAPAPRPPATPAQAKPQLSTPGANTVVDFGSVTVRHDSGGTPLQLRYRINRAGTTVMW